jgi:hypothetical protein
LLLVLGELGVVEEFVLEAVFGHGAGEDDEEALVEISLEELYDTESVGTSWAGFFSYHGVNDFGPLYWCDAMDPGQTHHGTVDSH